MVFTSFGNVKFAPIPFIGYIRAFPEFAIATSSITFIFLFPIFITKLINNNSQYRKHVQESESVRKARVKRNVRILFLIVLVPFLLQKKMQQFAKSTKDYGEQMKKSIIAGEVDRQLMKTGHEYYLGMQSKFEQRRDGEMPKFYSSPMSFDVTSNLEGERTLRAIKRSRASALIASTRGPARSLSSRVQRISM